MNKGIKFSIHSAIPALITLSTFNYACSGNSGNSHQPHLSPLTSTSSSLILNSNHPSHPEANPRPSAQLIEAILAQLQFHLGEPRVQDLFRDSLIEIEALFNHNRLALESTNPTTVAAIFEQLRRDHYQLLIDAAEGSEDFIIQMDSIRDSLQETNEQTQAAVEEGRVQLRNHLLRPFRQQVSPRIQPYIRQIFLNIYEQLHLNPAQNLAFPEGEIRTIDLAIAEASAAGARCTEAEWTDAFALEGIPVPPQDHLQGRWATRCRMALNVFMNHLQVGNIMLDDLSSILAELIESGAVPADYADQIFEGPAPDEALTQPYPSPENRRLVADLLALPELSFDSIAEAYGALENEANALREEMVALSQNHEAPLALADLQGVSLAELRIQVVALRAADEARRQAEEAALQAEQSAREAAERALRTQVARALGGNIDAASLTDLDRAGLSECLRNRLRELDRYSTLSENRRQQMDAHLAAQSLEQLLARAARLTNRTL
jgi:hypothetical protein